MITRTSAYEYNKQNIKGWIVQLLALQRLRHKKTVLIPNCAQMEAQLIHAILSYSKTMYPKGN